jgi:hypothetical protein
MGKVCALYISRHSALHCPKTSSKLRKRKGEWVWRQNVEMEIDRD